MDKNISRGVFIKMAAGSVVALALGLFKSQPAQAAFDPITVSAVVDFGRQSLDRFTFRAKFDGVSQPADPNNLEIKVSIKNIMTGEGAYWQGPPTEVR